MSFSAENFNRKLSGLQETQDSIVSISQWVLFHHRHCKESAKLWSAFTLTPGHDSSKRLSLLYLCNDVVQQARHKRRSEFISEFGKVLPDVLNKIYGALDGGIKPKVDRLVNVWEQRAVFNPTEIRKMRKAIELSKNSQSLESAAGSATSSAPKETICSDLKHLNNVFNHLNSLAESGQSYLNQLGVQSKIYLPHDPSSSDNLPSPGIYISKLNVLEKLCNIAKSNIQETQKNRNEIITQLDNLKILMTEGLQTDESKIKIIDGKMSKLTSTKEELEGMVGDTKEPTESPKNDEEPSPEFDNDDNDDLVPTYETEDSDAEDPPSKRFKSNSSSTSSTPTSVKKSVAFSEDIQIKEFDRDNETESLKIIKSDDDYQDEEFDGKDDEELDEVSADYKKHHKDDVFLKKEHSGSEDGEDEGDDGYNPSSGFSDSESNSSSKQEVTNDVLSLLSKLA